MAALLSACGLPADPPGPPVVSANPEMEPTAESAHGPTGQGGETTPEQVASSPRSPRGAAALKGMAAIEVTASLGNPTRLRRDRPAEIWQYVTAICVLDVFLYEEGGIQRVAHAQIRYPRGRSRDVEAQEQCFSAIFREQGQSRHRVLLPPSNNPS